MATDYGIASDAKGRVPAYMARAFIAHSVPFTSVAGDQNNRFTVPAGQVWELRSLRFINGEAASVKMSFRVVDGDGQTFMALSQGGPGLQTLSSGGELTWDGSVVIPYGWAVGVNLYGAAGGGACEWAMTALQRPATLI